MSEQLAPTPAPRQPGVPRWLVGALIVGTLLIIGLLVVVILLLSGGGDGESKAKGGDAKGGDTKDNVFTASGDVTLITSDLISANGRCQGQQGYSDLQEGAQVVIRDASGDTVAVDSLRVGVKEDSATCRFAFIVHDVPSGKGPYSIEVTHRGEIAFTEDTANDIHMSLSQY
jgi:hypothetical protein